MSTLAIDGSSHVGASRAGSLWRWADLLVLAAALPVFVLAELPMLGYAVAAAAWLAQRAILHFAERRARDALAGGERRTALGVTAISTLSRVWLLALAVLLVGVLADREDGLAAALLVALLFTIQLGGQALSRISSGEAR